ncbi:MAG: HD domain-containing phosphohydrolase [Noviherbaspirillum sp.]
MEPHREAILPSLLVMAWMVEARDPYTGGHLWRVSRFARLLAMCAHLPEDEVARITLGGFLHDLGKIVIPDPILRKPGPLTNSEYAVIRTHPEVGIRSLALHPLAGLVRDAVLSHHERPDGTGYPNGLSGDRLPAAALIVGICDAFDAMTSARPYRKAMPIADALDIMEARLGKQFEPGYGQRFIAMGHDGVLDHIVGHSDERIPLLNCPWCGPILVMHAGQRPGSHIFCRNCGGAFVVEADSLGKARAVFDGRHGTPQELEPEADNALITRIVQEAAAAVPAA